MNSFEQGFMDKLAELNKEARSISTMLGRAGESITKGSRKLKNMVKKPLKGISGPKGPKSFGPVDTDAIVDSVYKGKAKPSANWMKDPKYKGGVQELQKRLGKSPKSPSKARSLYNRAKGK